MKKLMFAVMVLCSSQATAWWGGYGGYGYGMGFGYGMPWGAYGAMGYGYAIPTPSFNYTTVINSQPPVIVIQQPNNQSSPQYSQEYYQRSHECNSSCNR